jgi:DNA-binding transcriptional regulator GbsR (MarR family)
MAVILTSILCFFTFTFHQTIDAEKLKKDPVLMEYKKVSKEIREGIVKKKYSIPKNFYQLMQELGENSNSKAIEKKLTDAGMKNAGEFLEKITRQENLMKAFLKKHPEIQKMEPLARQQLIVNILKD